MKSQEEALQEQYRLRFDSAGEYRDRVWKTLCRSFFSRLLPANATVIDVGCGWGEFINNVSAAKKYAIDLNPDAEARLNDDIAFIHQDCSQPWPVETGSLDFVFSSNFFEHLPTKPAIEATLQEAYRALKPGGSICLIGPNIRHLPGAYWDFWDHHIPLSDLSISEVLRLTGFTVTRTVDRFLPYTMSGRGHAPMVFIKAYLRFPLAWKLLGKQFLVIARK